MGFNSYMVQPKKSNQDLGQPIVAKLNPAIPVNPNSTYSGYSPSQMGRVSDAVAGTLPFVSTAGYNADVNNSATTAALAALGLNSDGTPISGGSSNSFQQMLASLSGAGTGGGTGGGSSKSGYTTGDARMAELTYQQQKDAIAAQRLQDQIAAMTNDYKSGGYNNDISALMNTLAGMQTTGQQGISDVYNNAIGNINSNYDTSISNIGQGYTQAQDLTGQGYSALNDYLTKNQINPYANMQATVSNVLNPQEAVLNAYGANDPRVQGQIAASQAAGQTGGAAFNDLIRVLSGQSNAGNESRLSEAQMANTLAQAGLTGQKAAYTSRAESSKAQASAAAQLQQEQALNQLAQQIASQQFSLQSQQAQQKRAAEQALIDMGIDPATLQPLIAAQTPTQTQTGLSPDELMALQARRGM
jgi:hypothetical protein